MNYSRSGPLALLVCAALGSCGKSTKHPTDPAQAGKAAAGSTTANTAGNHDSGSDGGAAGAPGNAAGVSGTAGEAGAPSRLRAIRIHNETNATVYLKGKQAVLCEGEGGAECFLFVGPCRLRCSEVTQGMSCCIQCEQPLPEALVISAGQTRDIPWDGIIYNLERGPCSECTCGAVAARGRFEISINVYPSVTGCPTEACEPDAMGVIAGATPSGTPKPFAAAVSMPFEGADEVVTITVR